MQLTSISRKDASTMGQIYQHPVSQNLEWPAVVALMGHLGTVTESDYATFVVNGVSQGFLQPKNKDVSDPQQILELRRFLEKSGYGLRRFLESFGNGQNRVVTVGTGLRLLVVIDLKETRVFQTETKGAIPQGLKPYNPRDNLRFLMHKERADRDAAATEDLAYYEAIAATLSDAAEILVIGNGAGAASAIVHLQDFLVMHHPETATKIVGTLTVDISPFTEGEMLEKARDFYTLHDSPGAIKL